MRRKGEKTKRMALRFIIRHLRDKGYGPTSREIGEAIERSNTRSFQILRELQNEGLIVRSVVTSGSRSSSRGMVVTDKGRAWCGNVASVPVLGECT